MQDIIARALALRNNGSSSGASVELAQKVQKIEDEYVRATDEKDIEEISSSIEAIKQEIEDKGAEVKASLDLNSAIKAIHPLSEIVNYGGRYAVTGPSEFARITSETKADGIVFIARVAGEGITGTTIQFWDSNKKTYNIGIRLYAMIHNDGSSIHVFSDSGSIRIDYNADGTFKTADTTNLYIDRGHVLDKYNTAEYTPTKDYHPATKKYVDDTISASTSANDSIQYYCFANDSLYKANSTTLGNATATETKLTVDEVTELVTKAHTTNIIFFSGDSLFPSNKIIVYKVVDAYEAYGYHYFTTIKSDRANATSETYALCVQSYNRD